MKLFRRPVSRRGVLRAGLGLGAFSAAAGLAGPLAGRSLAASAASGLELHAFTLDNGMDVVFIPDHRLPLITHDVWYRIGAVDEVKGEYGIAHYFEHLMFKGTKRFPKGTLDRFVSRYGGYSNAETSYDYTHYIQRMHKQYLFELMDMEADRMSHLEFQPNEIAIERNVVLEEKRRGETQASTLYWNEANALLFPDHRQGISTIGLEEDLNALGPKQLEAFYRLHYAPNNAILIVAGDLTLDELTEMARKTYGAIPTNPDLKPRSRAAIPAVSAKADFVYPTEQVSTMSINRIFRVPGADTISQVDNAALRLLANLSNGFGYPQGAYNQLVIQQKVASTASADYSRYMSMGTFTVGFTAVPGMPVEAGKQVLDALVEGFRASPPSEDAVAGARTNAIVENIKSLDSQATLVNSIGGFLTKGLTLAQHEAYPDTIKAVTAADVKRVIDTYLVPSAAVTGAMVPKTA